MNIMVGRAIALVGIVLAFVAIWVSAFEFGRFGISYWDSDGTLGSFLLALACLAALLLVLALATGQPLYDLALAVVGSIMFGMYLFFPALFAGDHWDSIGSGGWMGVCTLLVAVGAIVSYLSARRSILAERATPSQHALVGAGSAAVGLVLVLVGIFLDVERGRGGGSYWSVPENGHSLGVLFLIVLIVCAVALAVGVGARMPVGTLLAACLAGMLFGMTFFIPVTDAFKALDDLDIGAWLAFIGGVLAAAGAVFAWHTTITPRVAAPTPAAPPAPPPAPA